MFHLLELMVMTVDISHGNRSFLNCVMRKRTTDSAHEEVVRFH